MGKRILGEIILMLSILLFALNLLKGLNHFNREASNREGYNHN